MKTSKLLHVLSVFLLLSVCLMGICSAAVSVNNVNSQVGPQATLTAAVTDINAESYQWYTCDANGENAVAIEGAVAASYSFYLDAAGTTYYKVVVNGTDSAVATVTATMPDDYHIFMLNSENEVKAYVGASGVPGTAELVNIDGYYAMQYNATKGDAATNFPISYIKDIYLQGYPYLVFSLNYDSLTVNPVNFQIRSYTDRTINGNFHFQPAKSGFVKYIVNTNTAKYVGYDKNGKQVVSGSTYIASSNAGKWKAKLTQLRLDFDVPTSPVSAVGQPIQLEYMGFFPTEAMAKAYNGEMPLDTESEKILDPFDNAEVTIDRNEYPTQESIEAYVAEIAAEADAAVASVKAGGIANVTYSIENATYTEGTDYNCYTFTVDVLVGDNNFKRSRIRREYKIFAIGNVTVADKTVTVGPDATITSAFEGDDSLSYQWYTCNADGSNAVAIEGATKPSYTRHVDEAGTIYYKLVVNGVKESNVATFTAEMPKEPIVLKFNNKYDTAYWSTNLGYTKYLGVPVYQRAHAGNTNDDTTTITNIASYNVYLAAYPVIVVKSAYPEHPANNVDIYVGTDRDGNAPALNTGATTMHTHVGAEFVKLVFDSTAENYKVYKADGTVSKQGNVKFGSVAGSKQGKLDYLRFDLSNGAANYQDVYYFEYVGFFPTVEMANAYTGAMPADEYSNVVISAFEDAEADDVFVMEYDQAMTEAKAEAFAKALYDEISAEAIAEVKAMGINTVDVTYTAGEYTPYNPYGNFLQNGSYTFKVSVLAGDTPLQRSYLETEVTVLLMGNQPNVFIEDITVPAGPQVTLTPEIIPGLEATSFQWFRCDDAEGTNPVAIEGATSGTYTLYPLAGANYYMLMVNGTESSNVVTLTGTLPDEPVVWRFNNEIDIENWIITTSGGSGRDLVTYGGKLAYTYLPKNDGNTTFSNLAKYNDFYLQSYPYIVISASYPDYVANATIDVYIGADGFDAEYRKNNYNTNFSVTGSKPAVNAGYSKTIIDLSTAKYKSYNENGALIRDAQADFGYMGKTTQNETLIGKFAYLRTDFSNNNAGKPCYIEYIGFFPTMEMALAYNGELPNDEELASVVNTLNTNGIKVPFAVAGTEATAAAGVDKYAKKAINAAISALESDCGSATITVSNGVYSRPTKYGSGTYTADIEILLGDATFGRSQTTIKDFVFTLTAKPDPVVMVFDTAEKVSAASVAGYLASKTFVEENGRKFMRLVTNGTGDNYLDYLNIYEQTGNKIVPAEYPYMKMSYRRATPSSAGEGVQLYFANKSFYALYYPSSNYDNPYWEEFIVDLRNPKATMNYIREDGTSGRYANVQIYNGKSLEWDNFAATKNSDIEFRLTRYGSAARTLDYEYIGYFATEEEARLYPNAERHYDTEALKAANAFNAAEGVETQEQAEAAAEAYLEAFGFASNYTIDTANAVYTAPTYAAEGSYVFDVWFGADRKAEYTVTVTMTLNKLPMQSVAMIGDMPFETLDAAIEAATNGDIIVLVDDIEQEDGVIITDKNLTIDLADHTFTVTTGASTNNRNLLINGTSVVWIKNGTMIAAGNLNSGAYGTVRTDGNANVTLTDLVLYNYRGNGLNIKALGNSTVNISDTVIYAQYGGGIEAAGGTIELTGVTVEQKGMWTAPYNSMAISVNGGGKVTVNSGSYSTEPLTAEEANGQGTSHGSWAAGVLNSGGTLIIKGGTFTNGNYGDDSLATAARGLILADTGAVVEINGGTFNALKSIIDIQNNFGDEEKNPTGTITGGTFSADPTNSFVTIKDGFKVEELESGKYQVVEINYVAEIDGVQYETLQAAFASIPASTTATVTILNDFEIEGNVDGVITINNNKNVTLDLNGKTITTTDNATGNFSLFFIGGLTDGTLTVMDSAESGKIELTSTINREWGALSGIFHNRGGVLIVESGSYIHNGGTDMAWVIDNSANSYGDAVTTVNGGTLVSSYTAIRNRMEAYGANGGGNGIAVLNVNGGSINGTTSAIWGQASSSNANQPAKGEITVTGGDIGTINVARNATSDAITTISGGTVANIKAKAGEVHISGGTLTGALAILDANGNTVENDAVISGGTFYSDLSAYVANGYEIVDNGNGTYGVDVVMLANGDINGDGAFSVSDIIFTMQSLASSGEFDETQITAADVTGDGVIDVSDVIRMLQYLALK